MRARIRLAGNSANADAAPHDAPSASFYNLSAPIGWTTSGLGHRKKLCTIINDIACLCTFLGYLTMPQSNLLLDERHRVIRERLARRWSGPRRRPRTRFGYVRGHYPPRSARAGRPRRASSGIWRGLVGLA